MYVKFWKLLIETASHQCLLFFWQLDCFVQISLHFRDAVANSTKHFWAPTKLRNINEQRNVRKKVHKAKEEVTENNNNNKFGQINVQATYSY